MATLLTPAYTEGHIPYIVGAETYQTYYKVYGSLESGKAPIIALHGGPGLTHKYLSPLGDVASESTGELQRPVIVYDQLGNGLSTHLREKPKEFWQLDLFVNELSNLIRFFRLSDPGYHIYGHSWGGVLGSEYVLSESRVPGVKSLVLADSLPSWQHWQTSQVTKVMALGPELLEDLKLRFSDLKKYRNALEKFHAVHGCTVKPTPKDVADTFDQLYGDKETGEGGDDTVEVNMFANFLTKWDITDRLHNIDVPSFVIHGLKDISDETVNAPFFWKIPKVKWLVLENSTHLPMWEERERYTKIIGEWANALDN